MALGPGKYDSLCTLAREHAQAQGAILIILGGKHGNGFSCQAELPIQLRLPAILRDLADSIEADLSYLPVKRE